MLLMFDTTLRKYIHITQIRLKFVRRQTMHYWFLVHVLTNKTFYNG
jgi:hypothetical protein